MSEADFRSVIDALSASGTTPPTRVAPVRRVAVLGAGAVGRLLACRALAIGLEVSLHSVYGHDLEAMRAAGGITVRGADLVGTYAVGEPSASRPAIRLADSVDEAVEGADVVLVATPSAGQRSYASLLAGVLVSGQSVVLVPGRFMGTLAFHRELVRHQCTAEVTLAELAAPPYLATADGARLSLHAVAGSIEFATFPLDAAAGLAGRLETLLPMAVPVASPLVAGFAGVTGIVCAAPLLVNTRMLDDKGGDAILLKDVITPSLSRTLLRQLDAERLDTAFRYGVRDLPGVDGWLERAYGDQADPEPDGPGDLARTLEALEAFDEVSVAGVGGPHLTDDVPNTLVPLSLLAHAAGVPTPATDTVIDLASCLIGWDQRAAGRTLDELGLAGVRPQDAHRHLAELGTRPAQPMTWWRV